MADDKRIRSYTDIKHPAGYLGGNPLEEKNWDDKKNAYNYIKVHVPFTKKELEMYDENDSQYILEPLQLRRSATFCGICEKCHKKEGYYKFYGYCKNCFKK